MAYMRPGFFMRRVMNPLVQAFKVKPTLAVKGRNSGKWRTVPVNVLEHDGQRYLIAIRGETEWVRNLRAAGSGEIRQGEKVERFTGTEVPVEERPPIIAAYRSVWEREVASIFSKLPDPVDHPVFRIEYR
jgi:deazaflavin-dependent oxidoreductase (nitroreductase family)